MSDTAHLREPDGKEASSRLDQGLKSCRAVVANYRVMLVERCGEQSPSANMGALAGVGDTGEQA